MKRVDSNIAVNNLNNSIMKKLFFLSMFTMIALASCEKSDVTPKSAPALMVDRGVIPPSPPQPGNPPK
jgi:hypothetical protein